ncbi:TetR family transcriptional regulator C-terminal domain-containing protein [Mycobacterium sp. CVI_P3]|uniref:TetR family transcriptional regulator C-terminal domain-containing protein n=1 Tax=Mycobacterium pinniadriaticum TaxID=2994102 RepID=A0ABT3S9U0_9MYCO|nr:TetR family transcriptional regulator C-terminal domain-containing protein [Mycobacterium pinniadriaticum]MCX2929469.1 TetR family transcriptional regulator C-terminal domain-containing protein [Mycobacterium pinniadriaticum]MCX2935893.1 TetR family transcriptional regulator C-terminal domain-containing protein [Mycobacterium pinniadriaticum]
MPKQVDHDERRREITAAMWRILLRDGMGAVTVRALAAEAGWSVGALRHYYRSQDDLILFATGEMLTTISQRIYALDLDSPDRGVLQQAIEEMLPLDRQRKAEAQVWFALLTRRVASPQVAAEANELDLIVRDAVHQVLTKLNTAQLVSGQRDLEVEAVRLHALIDGLALHALSEPPLDSPTAIRAAISTHLRELAR